MVKEIAIIALAAVGVTVALAKKISSDDKFVAAVIIAIIIAVVANTA